MIRATGALAAAAVFAASAVYAGCSSSDDAPAATNDGGAGDATSDTSNPQDSGSAHDGGADADASASCPPPAPGDLPTDLRCTGLYADFAAKTPAQGVRAYSPGVAFWSDGAQKQRWISLPAGKKIDTTDMDEWSFPDGTKIWKEFKLGGKRIETRLFAKVGPPVAGSDAGAATWAWGVYRWSSDESTATLLTTGETNVNGTRYEVPTPTQCDQCHQGKVDKILGFEALNMGLASATGVTLATLVSEGVLTKNPPTSTFAIPEDATGKAREALGFMHVNCGSACHNASLNAPASFTGLFLRVRTAELTADGGAIGVKDLDAYKTSVNQDVRQLQGFRNQGYKLIAAHDVAKSLIPLLAGSRDQQNIPQMPPLVTHIVDDAGVGKVDDWIGALPDGGL